MKDKNPITFQALTDLKIEMIELLSLFLQEGVQYIPFYICQREQERGPCLAKHQCREAAVWSALGDMIQSWTCPCWVNGWTCWSKILLFYDSKPKYTLGKIFLMEYLAAFYCKTLFTSFSLSRHLRANPLLTNLINVIWDTVISWYFFQYVPHSQPVPVTLHIRL